MGAAAAPALPHRVGRCCRSAFQNENRCFLVVNRNFSGRRVLKSQDAFGFVFPQSLITVLTGTQWDRQQQRAESICAWNRAIHYVYKEISGGWFHPGGDYDCG